LTTGLQDVSDRSGDHAVMKYKEYIAKVEFDDSAGLFHGEVVNLRDVITFAGKTVGELRKAFRDSMNDYLEFCKAQSGLTARIGKE
jgi:predicted HicB family RNase H-like nuclease